jgi:serine/threonine-protein kinase
VDSRPADRWHRVDALFREILELDPGARRAALAAAAVEEEVRREVEELLRAAEEGRGFLEGTGARLDPATLWERVKGEPSSGEDGGDRTDRSGERVGPYRLVRRLGRGGMATVYLGERADGLWEQEVAVKLIRRGLDTDDVVARFLSERQILSSLAHPNIARLLDGGTTPGGLPYLVMEYVDGTPITAYCDRKRLPLDARLDLFASVVRAVQHAHRSLVVHRDLKPSNILVTDGGRVKLLDFGIARILDTSADPHTRPGLRPLTPAYASPEQLAGGTITTASDVFQLGILLAELAAGARPFDGATDPTRGLGREGRGRDPCPPSARVSERAAELRSTRPAALRRRLRGDLDTMVLRAVRLDPDDRYPSAEALLADVERHRSGLPIEARPWTLRYRARKLLRRRPWLAPVGLILLVGMVGYLALLLRHGAQLERERDLARTQAARAAEVQEILIDLFRTADPYVATPSPEEERDLEEILERGAQRVRRSLEGRPGPQGDLLAALAGVYANLDRLEPARALAEEALARHLEAGGPGSAAVARDLQTLGMLMGRSGRPDSAEALLDRSLRVLEADPATPDTARAAVLIDLGILAQDRGRTGEAERHLSRAIALLQDGGGEASAQLARAYTMVSATHAGANDLVRARAAAETAIRLTRQVHGETHPATGLALRELADLHDWEKSGRDAVPIYRKAIEILDGTLGPRHVLTLEARNNLAVTLRQLGAYDEAEAVLLRVAGELRRRDGPGGIDLADVLQNLAVVLHEAGDLDGAARHLREARTLYDGVLGPDHYRRALPRLTLAAVLLDLGAYPGAEAAAREAEAILARTLPEDSYVRATASCRLGRALGGQGRTGEALALLESAVERLEAGTQPSSRYEIECREGLARLYRDLERDGPAETQLREVRRLRAGAGPE